MTLTLKHIPKEQIEAMWSQLCPFIEDALVQAKATEYGVEEAKQFLLGGQMVAIGFFDDSEHLHGAITVSVMRYPRETIAFITSIGGRMIANRDTLEQLNNICRSFGAKKLQGYARESVARLWKRLGFSHRAILVELDL